ncbi:MAG: hypothetical protein HYY53_00900 [candidate division NC10 bacterium]|nr:hypothetical protein [candidate division NC10 bacterium]MBI4413376.1 hypothetical protein [candidate division NC10 bacterium]
MVHGEDVVYVGRGVGVLWGILRGPDEARSMVVLRIVPLEGAPAAVAVEGVDPFTKARRVILPGVPLVAPREVRIPRPAIGDHPRTELHFAPSPTAATGEAAAFTLYFNGLPDTVPELPDESALVAYLRGALERARARAGGTKP